MTVETALFIKDLNETYPRSRDLINEGDDHIRLIKSTIKNTFPGINTAVTFSADELNRLDSALDITDEGITLNSNLTVASGKAVDLGGGVVKGVGAPVDPTDGVNLAFLRASGTWPIGSVYISTDPRNPNIIFGFGTWESFSQGRVIIGSGSTTDINNETKAFSLGASGGEYSHKILTSEMPSHKHSVSGVTLSSGGEHSHDVDLRVRADFVTNGNTWNTPTGAGAAEHHSNQPYGARTKTTPGHTHLLSGEVDSTGGTTRANVIQPFIVCNIWVRTA